MLKRKTLLIMFLVALVGVFSLLTIHFSLSNNSATEKTNEAKVYEVSSYITDEMLENTESCKVDLCLSEEFNPENVGEDADEIIIGSVISLDGVKADEGLFGITTGKLLVNKTLSGTLQEGQVIEYMKNGGVMKMSDWEATQPESANNKRKYLREQAGKNIDLDNTYIDVSISNDVDIEAGYTYLIYLKKNGQKYEIIGLDVGLRKVSVDYSNKISTQNFEIGTLKVMNNKTGEFESLQNYINSYINNSKKE